MESNNLAIILGLAGIIILYIFNAIRSRSKRANVKSTLETAQKIVDVRSPSEFKSGHYPGAVNIPLDSISKKINAFGNKEDSIVVYCASGARSAAARSQLLSAGFTNVTNAGALSSLQ
jgi:phage shock protein E